MLTLTKIEKNYQKSGKTIHALRDVSLEVSSGEFVVVRGPSGCGKTTLLLAAGGLLEPDRGNVLIDGENPYRLPVEERARLRARKIGFVFQQFHLIPYLTVIENILAPSIAVPDNNARTRAEELIDQFNLSERAGHIPAELSTGERQRTALARALFNKPGLLLADEPTGNLDAENAAVVVGHMGEFARNGGSVLMVTHEEVAKAYTDRIITLDKGRIA